MEFDELTNPEIQEKLKNAKTPEELLTIVKECGVELEDDQLTTVAGRMVRRLLHGFLLL